MCERQLEKTYEFIQVQKLRPMQGRKTATRLIVNKRSGDLIGELRWYGPWRQWCFFPCPDTVWSAGCVRDVLDAISRAKEQPGFDE